MSQVDRDARLIEAAPEMLAMLIELEEDLKYNAELAASESWYGESTLRSMADACARMVAYVEGRDDDR